MQKNSANKNTILHLLHQPIHLMLSKGKSTLSQLNFTIPIIPLFSCGLLQF